MMGLNKLTQFDLTVPEKHHMFHFSFCVRVGYMALVARGTEKRAHLKLLISRESWQSKKSGVITQKNQNNLV